LPGSIIAVHSTIIGSLIESTIIAFALVYRFTDIMIVYRKFLSQASLPKRPSVSVERMFYGKSAAARLTGEKTDKPELREYINRLRSPQVNHSGIRVDLSGTYCLFSGMYRYIPSGRMIRTTIDK